MAEQRLAPGDAAPDFTLPDADGAKVSLSDYRGKRVIIYFYPAAMTPGCTKHACDFRDSLASLSAAGLTVLGISPDGPAKLARFRERDGLNFPLLSDPDRSVLQAYGAYGEKMMYGKGSVGVIGRHSSSGRTGSSSRLNTESRRQVTSRGSARSSASEHGAVAQRQEAQDLGSWQCGFESHRPHLHVRRSPALSRLRGRTGIRAVQLPCNFGTADQAGEHVRCRLVVAVHQVGVDRHRDHRRAVRRWPGTLSWLQPSQLRRRPPAALVTASRAPEPAGRHGWRGPARVRPGPHPIRCRTTGRGAGHGT